MSEEMDNPATFEAEKTAHNLPLPWLILFFGLIIWGVLYFLAYTPEISGWSQERAYTESLKE